MMRTWTHRALAALIAVTVAALASRAAPETPLSTDDKLNRILDQLTDLNIQLDLMRASATVQREEIGRLRVEMDRLKEDVRRLQTTTSTAASINPESPVSPTPAPTGAVVVTNQTASSAKIFINGRPYAVMPFEQTRIEGVPARFNYSVSTDDFGPIQASTTRTLIPGRDFPISIHP